MIDNRKNLPPFILDEKSAFLTRLHKIKDGATQKKLLIKVMDDVDDGLAEEILLAEFRKMIHLSSLAGICSVYFLCKVEINSKIQTAYVMEFVSETTLRKFISSDVTINFYNYLSMIETIYTSLRESHKGGIVHGDLHDENVLLNGFNTPVIIDFSFCKTMSPENMRNDFVSFVEINNSLFKKLDLKDQSRYLEFRNFIGSLDSFEVEFGKIKSLAEIFEELSYLPFETLPLLDSILLKIPTDFNFSQVLSESGLHIDTKYYSTEFKKRKFDLDTTAFHLESTLKSIFEYSFGPLKSLGLVSKVSLGVNEQNDGVTRSFSYSYSLHFTFKFLKWTQIKDEFNFLKTDLDLKQNRGDLALSIYFRKFSDKCLYNRELPAIP